MDYCFWIRESVCVPWCLLRSKGIPPLKDALINEPEDHLKADIGRGLVIRGRVAL